MYNTPSDVHQASIFCDLEFMLDHSHPLYKLANKIDWKAIEEGLSKNYCKTNGRPPKPIRLMAGLLILKHVRNVSDESIVEQFSENAYYQYFCGLESFEAKAPCAASELVHFRKRVKEEGIELILKESIRINVETEDKKKKESNQESGKDNRGRKPDEESTAFIDSTVQEKNITFPTDSKLLNKAIEICMRIGKEEGIKFHQTHAREIKELKLVQRFRGKKNCAKKVRKADKRMRTIAGMLLRELLRKLPKDHPYKDQIDICMKFVKGEGYDGHKIYSLHEPDVLCIAKGKDHVKYEFGNKVSIVRLSNGIIIGALSFRNEYDGHTVAPSVEQVRRLYDRPLKVLAGDRGYRGVNEVDGIRVMIPGVPEAGDTEHMKKKKHNMFRKRAGIEPVIGHCKSDHRLSRNFHKGIFGDNINVMLSAAAFNFKRAMNLLFCPFWKLQQIVNYLLDFQHGCVEGSIRIRRIANFPKIGAF